jgi:uncharacterized protein YyaL (SSP411 family)
MHKHTNQLIHETSPYLLQHAYNPVNWYPWGNQALQKAKELNKPILVSIGYAACHWCHVMERESFENEITADIMNEHFINIKIDREERPDLDHIYMDAVQAMTGSGGWPLNVFLTPDAKPFYGGTYFPPVKAHNRESWTDVLMSVAQAFTNRRHEIDAQAENLTQHLFQANSFGLQKPGEDSVFQKEKLQEAFINCMKNADKEWGGFGKAPKFPQTFTIQFLLRHYYLFQVKEALDQALLSLDKMIEGGIYDQVGGGFARYSTDTEWLAPHFEKMLYDNALLISVLSEAYQLTGKLRYKEVIDETMQFIQRELIHPEKGFYAALDADSEGVEGKFYVWQKEEVEELLGKDAAIFCQYYDITEKGNWSEGHANEPVKNILRVKEPLEIFAVTQKLDVKELTALLATGRKKLLNKRAGRIRPQLDDKIILSWNALMNTACSKAFAATGNETYRQLAIDNMRFILEKLSVPQETAFYHTWKNDQAKYPAFLDDYAFLIQALLHLQEISGDSNWLLKAKEIAGFVIEQFSEEETSFFYYTKKDQTDVIVRKKEVYDGAVPSGNSIMAANLYQLALLLDIQEWKKRAFDMVDSLGRAITRYPTSFGCWNVVLQEMVSGTVELAIVGKEYKKLHKEILAYYVPHRVMMVSETGKEPFPLLLSRAAENDTLVYVCKEYACLQPVKSTGAVIELINRAKKDN